MGVHPFWYCLIRYLEGWAGRLACGEMHSMLYQSLSVRHLYLGHLKFGL